MAERFKILQTLSPAQFATDNSSVQIVAARVLEDAQNCGQYLQVKFTNQSNQTLTGLDVAVLNGEAHIAIQHYASLNLKPGDSVGSKTLISIPDSNDFSALKLRLTTIQFERTNTALPPDMQNNSCESPAIKSSKKVSVDRILLIATIVFLLVGLALSFCKCFEGITYQRSAFLGEDTTSWPLSLLQLISFLSGADYAPPFPLYFGTLGYFISSVLAVLLCLWYTKKEKAIPVIKILPILPFCFSFSIIGMLDSRNFVSISNQENAFFTLKQISVETLGFIWLVMLLVATVLFLAFLIVSRLSKKKKDIATSKNHFSFKTAVCILIEVCIIIAAALFGDFVYASHKELSTYNQLSIHALYQNQVAAFISEKYGVSDVQFGDQTIFAITQNNLGSGYNILDRDELYDSNSQFLGYVYFCGTVENPHKNILTDSYNLSLSYELMDTLSTPEAEDQSANSTPAPDYSGYWYNGNSTSPYYLSIEEDSSGSFLNIEVYSDYYKWTATAHPSTTDTFTYDDGFQQSYSEDFNLPDLEGTITFDFDKHTVTWKDDSDETVTFTTSISASDFNSFVEKVTAVTESYSDDSQPIIEPIDFAGHYWCEQNSGDAYISIYSAPEDNQEVGNIEIYSQLEKANFSGILYNIGNNEYETIAETGIHFILSFSGDSNTPIFELYSILPSGNRQSYGEYTLDEHYYS